MSQRTEFIMSMPITVTASAPADVVSAVFDRFRQIEERYSPFRESSEVRQFQRQPQLAPNQELADILSACGKYEQLTGGYFSARFGGQIDPTGYVKGWAIRQAANILEAHKIERYLINAGGDIWASSQSSAWRIGIQDPTDRTKLLTTLAGQRLAIATSGTYERGPHIINPLTGQPATGLLSVSVVGPDIIEADVFATAVFAMGWRRGLKFIEQHPAYAALFVTQTGRVETSSNLVLDAKKQTAH